MIADRISDSMHAALAQLPSTMPVGEVISSGAIDAAARNATASISPIGALLEIASRIGGASIYIHRFDSSCGRVDVDVSIHCRDNAEVHDIQNVLDISPARSISFEGQTWIQASGHIYTARVEVIGPVSIVSEAAP
jgi:hypothetical protein